MIPRTDTREPPLKVVNLFCAVDHAFGTRSIVTANTDDQGVVEIAKVIQPKTKDLWVCRGQLLVLGEGRLHDRFCVPFGRRDGFRTRDSPSFPRFQHR